MTLLDWVKLKGDGELARLHRATVLSYTTVFKLARGTHAAKFSSGRKLAIETAGRTSHLELCLTPGELAEIEAWERKRWQDFALGLEKERAERAAKRGPKRASAA
jgi:hypothetical protein